MIYLFGIRHHGPGSAKCLLTALNEVNPDIILLEGTAETDQLMKYVGYDGLKPPVAQLIFNPKNFNQVVYYPFTEFSPEWQTLLFANNYNIPVVNFDLPHSIRFALRDKKASKNTLDVFENELVDEKDLLRKDPLGFIASLAGYEDVERWWEVNFEHYEGKPLELFKQTQLMIKSIREEDGIINTDSPEEILREAYMRKSIRDAIKKGFKRITVVCGAWHTAALELELFSAKNDNQILKGLPKIKLQSSWIPWNYHRISKNNGYGAGVISPAWYEMLFKSADPVSLWMATLNSLLKSESMGFGAANSVEAIRLAESLASLRGILKPGIDELFEAALSVFGPDAEKMIELIKNKLIIGDKIGEVPDILSNLPLQKDIDSQIKSLRLSKYKISIVQEIKKGGLDLRNEFDRQQSVFLHRLLLISVPWGNLKAASGKEKITAKEFWEMYWDPEYALQIIEASMWGNDLETVAINMVNEKAEKTELLSEMTDLLSNAIKAKLTLAINQLLPKLKDAAAVNKDITVLLKSFPKLIEISRYGDVGKTDKDVIDAVVDVVFPRICISLPASLAFLDEKSSKEMYSQIQLNNRAVNLISEKYFTTEWINTLLKMSEIDTLNPFLQGGILRILIDSGVVNTNECSQKIQYALSDKQNSSFSASWLDGFLSGSGLLLIHNHELWNIVDNWLDNLSEDNFKNLLPVLRRCFSGFNKSEKNKMFELVKNGNKIKDEIKSTNYDHEHISRLVPLLNKLLS